VFSTVVELDASTHQVAPHCLAQQNLARSRQIAHPLGDSHDQTGDVIAAHLDIPGMDTGPQVQADVLSSGQSLDSAA
jgi:hypothetical protein